MSESDRTNLLNNYIRKIEGGCISKPEYEIMKLRLVSDDNLLWELIAQGIKISELKWQKGKIVSINH